MGATELSTGDRWAATDWSIRPATADDKHWLRKTLTDELVSNGYFHGVHRDRAALLAGVAFEQGWDCLVVTPADDSAEQAGWVLFKRFADRVISHVMVPSIAMAFVDPSYRGLGAWRALRERIELRDGQLVNVVLASPAAMMDARKKYKAKHSWGRVIEWLL